MSSGACLPGVFSICFLLFVTIWVTSLGSVLRRGNFAVLCCTPMFRGPQMVRYPSALRSAPAQTHSSGNSQFPAPKQRVGGPVHAIEVGPSPPEWHFPNH